MNWHRDGLIFVSMEDWDDVWRRNQFLCAELCRRHAQLRIVFVGLARDVSNSVRTGRLSELRRPLTYRVPGLEQVTVTHAPKLFPNTVPVGRRANEAIFRRHVRAVAGDLSMRRPLLWLNPHSAVHAVGNLGESAVVYDVTDDWAALTQSRAAAALVAAQDRELCRQADAVIVCSDALHDMKRPLARNLHLIPNGVHPAHYASVSAADRRPAPDAARWPGPVLGYTGTVHPDRVDVPLVLHIARAHRGTVALVGPNHLSSADRAALGEAGNIILPGPVPYADVPRYMAAFDVCITPHRRNAFTESLNPIKLWEYLAAGLPIVSTAVPGFRDYPNLVRVADSPTDFVNGVRSALSEGRARVGERHAEAAHHSWGRRVDQVERVLASCVDRRSDPVRIQRSVSNVA